MKEEEEDRVKVKLELEPKDGKVDFNLDVAVPVILEARVTNQAIRAEKGEF